MTSEPRKATDILLELEQKLDVALSIIRAQDLNIKILSNKLNSVLQTLEKQATVPQKIMVEAVNTARAPAMTVSPFQQGFDLDSERQIPVSPEATLPLETEPKGFRRTSRPETFAGDDVYLQKSSPMVTPKYPTQIPKSPVGRNPNDPPPGRTSSVTAEVVVPPAPKAEVASRQAKQNNPGQNVVPVMQRVVNSQGKSLFLADVEIIDLSTMQQIAKTRTNGTGKWMASLGIGSYRIIIRKLEAATKERLEATQDIQIDGSQSPLELQTVIIKS